MPNCFQPLHACFAHEFWSCRSRSNLSHSDPQGAIGALVAARFRQHEFRIQPVAALPREMAAIRHLRDQIRGASKCPSLSARVGQWIWSSLILIAVKCTMRVDTGTHFPC